MAQAHQFVEAPPLNAPNLIKPVTPAPPAPPAPPAVPVSPSNPPSDAPPSVSSADILKRQTVKTKETNYREDLENIADPVVKSVAEKALKDYESGYNKKYEELASIRKELESKFNWTPERLASELRKPEFVQAMQILQQQSAPQEWAGTSEEWSALSESEKRQMQIMRQEQVSLQSQLASMRMKEEDVKIKEIFPEYEPQLVDEAIRGLSDGSITASRADIWKVVNHDKNVEKGYQFGYEDGYKKALEKLNGSSVLPGNMSVTAADEVPDDVRKGGFSSIAMWRLARSKNGKK